MDKLLKTFALAVVAGCLFGFPAAKADEVASCDANYTDGCVPIAYDVDCSNGTGDGPAYAVGPVKITGEDVYDLDRDNDGIGCELG